MGFKEPLWSITILGCTQVNKQTKFFLELELFYKQDNANLVIFCRNKGDCRRKKYVSATHLSEYLIPILSKPGLGSDFLQLPTKSGYKFQKQLFDFFPTLLSWTHTFPLPEVLKGKYEQQDVNFRKITTAAHIESIFIPIALWTTQDPRHR